MVAAIESIKAEIPVRVDVRELARIAVHPATAILRPTEKQVFVASAFDASEQTIPNIPVAWKSSDMAVCTVNASGLQVTAAGETVGANSGSLHSLGGSS